MIFEISSETLIEAFENVKEAVRKTEGWSRGGLMLGLQELGGSPDGFVGAYYPIESNIIVLNMTPLRRIIETDHKLLNPYLFAILLHEYLHSLGFIDEAATRRKAHEISSRYLGEYHPSAELSLDMERYQHNLVYPLYGWAPSVPSDIELVKGFDRSSCSGYFA